MFELQCFLLHDQPLRHHHSDPLSSCHVVPTRQPLNILPGFLVISVPILFNVPLQSLIRFLEPGYAIFVALSRIITHLLCICWCTGITLSIFHYPSITEHCHIILFLLRRSTMYSHDFSVLLDRVCSVPASLYLSPNMLFISAWIYHILGQFSDMMASQPVCSHPRLNTRSKQSQPIGGGRLSPFFMPENVM